MKRDKNIDKIIKENLTVENIPENFSNHVMQQIYESEKLKENVLQTIIQKHLLEEPSKSFTFNVMNKVKPSSVISSYQPVISKKAWFLILAANILILILALLNSDSSNNLELVDELISGLNSLFIFRVPELLKSPLFALSMFTLCALLFLDHFIRNRNKTLNSLV